MGPQSTPSVWVALRHDRPQIAVRLGLSAAAATALAAGAMLLAWGIGMWHWLQRLSFDPSPAAFFSLFVAAVAWLTALAVIWRPLRRRASVVGAIFKTLAIWLICLLFLFFAPRAYFARGAWWPGYGYLLSGLTMMALAATLGVWTVALHRWSFGCPIRNAEGRVNVHCPNCRYALTGLTECRCPECGKSWTIDELILAQGYSDDPAMPSATTERQATA